MVAEILADLTTGSAGILNEDRNYKYINFGGPWRGVYIQLARTYSILNIMLQGYLMKRDYQCCFILQEFCWRIVDRPWTKDRQQVACTESTQLVVRKNSPYSVTCHSDMEAGLSSQGEEMMTYLSSGTGLPVEMALENLMKISGLACKRLRILLTSNF